MTKQYQTKTIDASALAVPEQVSVAMNEIAENMQEGLLALAVGAGLQVMGALMEADVSAVAGPRGRHNLERRAVRHGTGAGSVTLGGRRVGVQRPRVRAAYQRSGYGVIRHVDAGYELADDVAEQRGVRIPMRERPCLTSGPRDRIDVEGAADEHQAA